MMKILKDKHRGDMAVEAMILTPLMFMTYLILLYFLFMSLTYVSYNNLANRIAQNMNMRQTGYKDAIAKHSAPPIVKTYAVSSTGQIDNSKYLSANKIIIDKASDTAEARAGLNAAIDKHKGQFLIPFNEVTAVELKTSKPIKMQEGRAMAGNVITVNLKFRSMVFGSTYDGKNNGLLPELRAVGYNTIN